MAVQFHVMFGDRQHVKRVRSTRLFSYKTEFYLLNTHNLTHTHIHTYTQDVMEELDVDNDGSISMNEFDSNGETSTGGGEDDGGPQVSNLQGSHNLIGYFHTFYRPLSVIVT